MGEHPPRTYPVSGSSSFTGTRSAFLLPDALAGYDAYENTRPVAAQHERLVQRPRIHTERFGYVYRGEVVLIHRIGIQFIRYPRPVEQPGRIGLVLSLHPGRPFDAAKL